MAFDTLYQTGNSTRNYPMELVLTNLTTGTLTKSPREVLALGEYGELDQLTLIYEGFVHLNHDIGGLFAVGDEPAGITTSGDWFVFAVGEPEYNGSWCSVSVRCKGLYAGGSRGSLAKRDPEVLALGGPGEIDELFLKYGGFVAADFDVGGLFAFGDTPGGLDTAGDWFVAGIGTPEYNGSWCSVVVRCEGLYGAKGNRIRWFANTEQQNADDITLVDGNTTHVGRVTHRAQAVGCEIDTILVGEEPDMAEVGLRHTPDPAPGHRDSDWDWLADPTYAWRNGWILDDIRASNVAGREDVWLATYVYRYVYAYAP